MANWSIADKRCYYFTNLGGQYLSEPGQKLKINNYHLIWYCAFLEKKKVLAFEKYLKSSSGFAFRNKHLI